MSTTFTTARKASAQDCFCVDSVFTYLIYYTRPVQCATRIVLQTMCSAGKIKGWETIVWIGESPDEG